MPSAIYYPVPMHRQPPYQSYPVSGCGMEVTATCAAGCWPCRCIPIWTGAATAGRRRAPRRWARRIRRHGNRLTVTFPCAAALIIVGRDRAGRPAGIATLSSGRQTFKPRVQSLHPPNSSMECSQCLRWNSALVRELVAFGFWTTVTVFVTERSKMATIRKRGNRWQAQIRLADHPPMSKSFGTKRAAESWARNAEYQLINGQDERRPTVTTLRDILERYKDTVIALKISKSIETGIVDRFLQEDIGYLHLHNFTREAACAYRDLRLATVKASTLVREIGILRHCWDVASNEWGVAPEPIHSAKCVCLG